MDTDTSIKSIPGTSSLFQAMLLNLYRNDQIFDVNNGKPAICSRNARPHVGVEAQAQAVPRLYQAAGT